MKYIVVENVLSVDDLSGISSYTDFVGTFNSVEDVCKTVTEKMDEYIADIEEDGLTYEEYNDSSEEPEDDDFSEIASLEAWDEEGSEGIGTQISHTFYVYKTK